MNLSRPRESLQTAAASWGVKFYTDLILSGMDRIVTGDYSNCQVARSCVNDFAGYRGHLKPPSQTHVFGMMCFEALIASIYASVYWIRSQYHCYLIAADVISLWHFPSREVLTRDAEGSLLGEKTCGDRGVIHQHLPGRFIVFRVFGKALLASRYLSFLYLGFCAVNADFECSLHYSRYSLL